MGFRSRSMSTLVGFGHSALKRRACQLGMPFRAGINANLAQPPFTTSACGRGGRALRLIFPGRSSALAFQKLPSVHTSDTGIRRARGLSREFEPWTEHDANDRMPGNELALDRSTDVQRRWLHRRYAFRARNQGCLHRRRCVMERRNEHRDHRAGSSRSRPKYSLGREDLSARQIHGRVEGPRRQRNRRNQPAVPPILRSRGDIDLKAARTALTTAYGRAAIARYSATAVPNSSRRANPGTYARVHPSGLTIVCSRMKASASEIISSPLESPRLRPSARRAQ